MLFQPPSWWKEVVIIDWLNSSYIVGGTVRDIVIKRKAVDFDLLVPELNKKKAFELADKIKSPGFKLGKKNYVYRIVTSEGKIDLIPLKHRSLEEEAKRRDFTVNSLLLPLSAARGKAILRKEIIDFLGGLKDLEKRILRLCHADGFKRDPVRLLRAVRFCLELGFRLDKDTANYLGRDKKLLSEVSGERIKAELFKLFSLHFPDKVVEKLISFSLWPEILNYGGLTHKPRNSKTQLKEALAVTKGIKKIFPDYFEKELEKGVKVKHLFYLFLALFLSTDDQSKIPSALSKLRLSRKAIKASQSWLRCAQKDWLKNEKSQAELVIFAGASLPACLTMELIINQRKLSEKMFLKFRKMYEIETGSSYPFAADRVIEETGLPPSLLLGKELKQRKIAFLTRILTE